MILLDDKYFKENPIKDNNVFKHIFTYIKEKPDNFRFENFKTIINNLPFDIYCSSNEKYPSGNFQVLISKNVFENFFSNNIVNYGVIIKNKNNGIISYMQNYGLLCLYDKLSTFILRNHGILIIKNIFHSFKLFTKGFINIHKSFESSVPIFLSGNINIYCDIIINEDLFKKNGGFLDDCVVDSIPNLKYYKIKGDYDIYNIKDLEIAIKLSNMKI